MGGIGIFFFLPQILHQLCNGQTEMDSNSNTIGTTVAVVEIEKPNCSASTEDVQLTVSTEEVKLTVKTDSETDDASTESLTVTISGSEEPK